MNIFLENETNFNNNGLGFLSECLSAIVTEELNGEFSLNITYPLKSLMSEYLIEGNIIKCNVGNNNYQLFRIKKVEKNFSIITVYATHIFYDLLDNFIEDTSPQNLNCTSFCEWILSKTVFNHNFSVFSDITNTKSARYVRRNPVECIIGDLDNSIINIFSAELERDNYLIKLLSRRGNNNNVKLIFGKNIKDISMTIDITSLSTKIMPMGYDGLMLPEKYVNSPLINQYPTPKILKYEFGNIKYDPDDEEAYHTLEEAYQALRDATNDLFAAGIDKPSINIKIDWLELSKTEEYYNQYSNLEKVNLGDTILTELFGLNYETRVIKTQYDVLLDRIVTYEIGTPKATFQNTINNLTKTVEEVNTNSILVQAKEDATNMINSAMGGYIYKTQNELFIMDTNNPQTATKVWRWNLNGLGYSKTGINGPYETAITQNGSIVADFITTGKLNTDVIEGYDQLQLKVREISEIHKEMSDNGSIILENAHEGPLHKLSIKGQMDFRTDSSLVTGDDLSDKLLKFSWPSEGTTVEHHITTDQEYEIIMSDNYQIRGGLNQALIISESYSLHDNNLTYIDTLYNESGLEVITSKNQYKLPNDFGVITFIDDGAEVLPYIKTPKFITKPKLLIDNIEYEIDLDYLNYISDTICDEFIYMDGKCSIIRRVGIDTNGNKYALESEIIEEREDIILEVKTNSTIYLQTVNDATYEVSYLLENEYTKTFANQLETKAEIEMMSNEIEAKVSAVTDENGEITSASIKLALNNDTSGIKLKSDMLDLDANKIINIIAGNEINLSSKSISINSDNFKVTTAGVLTASNVNITGGSIKLTATSLANIVQVGRDGGLRTVMQGNGLLGYNSNGNRMFYLSSMGGLVIDDGQITTPRISAGNIASGYDYANSSTDTTIYFGKTFPSTPAVVATAWTYTSGVIALKVRNITTTSFDIVVGGNVSGSIGFTWIAIG